jgi:serine/threonine protein kinase
MTLDGMEPFGRYLLLDRVAYGGMAEIFRAKQFGTDGFDRLIAIKRLLPNVADDKQFISMFRDEASITQQLHHPSIVQVFDFGCIDRSWFLAMEYISGVDLKRVWQTAVERGEPLAPPLTAFVVQAIAEGLGYAHRATDPTGEPLGIIHRDVSPQNILVGWQGDVKLVDFGIAKARQKKQKTEAGVLKGKFGYMSPEQVRGLPLRPTTDIFSLGVVLYEMLSGQRAFDRTTDYATMDAVRAVDVTPLSEVCPGLSPALIAICEKAMAQGEEVRYAQAEQVGRDLGRYLSTLDTNYGRTDVAEALQAMFPEAFAGERKRLAGFATIGPPTDIEIPEPIRGAGGTPQNKTVVRVGIGSGPVEDLPSPVLETPQQSNRRRGRTQPRSSARNKYKGLLYFLVFLAVAGVAGWRYMEYQAQRPGALAVSTLPAIVDVFLDGKHVGQTAASPGGRGVLMVEGVTPGVHAIRLGAKSYASIAEQVLISSNDTMTLRFNLPTEEAQDGSILLKVTPATAQVSLDGEPLELKDGSIAVRMQQGQKGKLTVRANNHTTATRIVGPVNPGSEQVVHLDLPLERWSLHLTTSPATALVSARLHSKWMQGKGHLDLRDLTPNQPISVIVKSKGCRTFRGKIRNKKRARVVRQIQLKCRR